MNRITLREEKEIQRADANEYLQELKAKESKRRKEFVSRRVDSRTIVMARPTHIDELINEIKNEQQLSGSNDL